MDRAKIEREFKGFRILCLCLAGLFTGLNIAYAYVNWLSMRVAIDTELLRAAGRRTESLEHSPATYTFLTVVSIAIAVVASAAFVLLWRNGPYVEPVGLAPLLLAGVLSGIVRGWSASDPVELVGWPVVMVTLAALWFQFRLKLRASRLE